MINISINSFSFTFSPRPGTPAFNLDKIDEKVAKNRLTEFQYTAEKLRINIEKI